MLDTLLRKSVSFRLLITLQVLRCNVTFFSISTHWYIPECFNRTCPEWSKYCEHLPFNISSRLALTYELTGKRLQSRLTFYIILDYKQLGHKSTMPLAFRYVVPLNHPAKEIKRFLTKPR